MNKRQKKKYTDRVYALVYDVTYESTGHKDIFLGSITAKGKAFRRCWGWMKKNDIFTPLFDDDPVILLDRIYSISLSVTPSGARMASVRTWRKWL